MSAFAIRVEHLGKQYRLGGQRAPYSTFRETLLNAAYAPLRWLKSERGVERNTFWALDDVSFDVRHGEAVGIIGRNGAGKSTLLKILSRITSPTRGQVDIFGRVGSLLEVGTGFHYELSGRENIYLNGAILGMSRLEIARKFDEIVDFSGVEKFLDTPVKHYSSGMFVRLAFAVAAHLEPEILIVDEVLAVGDAEFQKKCLGKMGEVAEGGRTVLFVSHNMAAVKRLCSRSLYIEEGNISFDGETTLAIQKYNGETKDLLVANFESDPNKTIRIKRLEVCAHSSASETGQIDTTDGVLIKVSYNVNKPISGAHVFIRLHMSDGETLIGTGDADTRPSMLKLRKPGQYDCQVLIPPKILGAGKYSITWSAGIPFQENFDVEFHALAFQIMDQRTSRGQFIHRERPGLLALDLDWKYETRSKGA